MNSERLDAETEMVAATFDAESLVHSPPLDELTEAELQQVAERVYRLMREEARLESARNGEFACER